MILELTQEHIDDGLRKHSGLCPIAQSILAHFGECCEVCVGGLGIHITRGDKKGEDRIIRYKATEKLRGFIRTFDRGRKVSPMRFRLIRRKPYDIVG